MEAMQNQTNERFDQLSQMFQNMSTNRPATHQAATSQEQRVSQVQQIKEKKVKCPRWMKNEPLKNFLSNLNIWNKCHISRGKYLEFLEALQESQRFQEKQRVELEVQNGNIDPCHDNVVEHLIN